MAKTKAFLLPWLAALALAALPACVWHEQEEHHAAAQSTVEMKSSDFFTPVFTHHLQPRPLFHLAVSSDPAINELTTFYNVNLWQVYCVAGLLVLFLLVRISFAAEPRFTAFAWIARVFRGWCHWLRDEVVYSVMGEEDGRKWAPLFVFVFFFIAAMNVVGLVPYSVTATACVMVTGAMAVITFALMVIGGMLLQGPVRFWKNLLPHGLPVALIPLMAFVEVVGLFVKPFALMIRLFANMLAGHLLIISFVGLIFVFAQMFGMGPLTWLTALPTVGMAVFILIIEALVVLLQAYIFTYLSVLFVQQSLHPEH